MNPYGHKWRTVIRPAALKRAGGVFEDAHYLGWASCQRCRIIDPPISVWQHSTLDVAHLDGNTADSSDENLAVLCRACHRSIDYPSWARLFKAWLQRQKEERAIRLDTGRAVIQAIRWDREVELIKLQIQDVVGTGEAVGFEGEVEAGGVDANS